jgi:hypothetical protein
MAMAWLVIPASKSAGPGAAPFMQALLKRRLPDILVGAGMVTVGAGLWLALLRGYSTRWQDWALGIGALSAMSALIVGAGWQRPTALQIQRLGANLAAAGTAPTAEQGALMAGLQMKMARFASILSVLLAAAVAGMALSGS